MTGIPYKPPFYEGSPYVTRKGLPRARREWAGRRVAIRYIRQRGAAWRRTDMRTTWGVLVPADRDDRIAVRQSDGTTKQIHYTRVTEMYDLTRTEKP